MRELHGRATQLVAASIEECFALLIAVDRYPDWYPETVRDVQVLDRAPGGEPSRVRTNLHVARGPLVKDFDLLMVVDAQAPMTVKLTRVSDTRSDQRFEVAWALRDGERTQIAVDLYASLNVPRFLPLGGVGDALAEGFVEAAGRAVR
jgi:ribosome-associated toxin RatA of RatAB toxin-antitoxin module